MWRRKAVRQESERKLTSAGPEARLPLVKNTLTVLIIVDGSDRIRAAGASIARALTDRKVVVMDAADFAATDLLPVHACFIGCEKPHPSGFGELERVLKGVNLAGRPCGLFSLASPQAIEYLRAIVRDADFRLNPAPFLAEKSGDAGAWVADTLGRR